jgi:hypothetical protein
MMNEQQLTTTGPYKPSNGYPSIDFSQIRIIQETSSKSTQDLRLQGRAFL